MKRAEAERLLGGYATGTLSEAERRILFEAALDHQETFDALMDEEALRDLLADPAAKAQLLAALGSAAPPRPVPFWRRTGVLGAAASLLVASLAGIAYLRSPDKSPPPLHSEKEKAAPAPATGAQPPPPAPAPPAARPRNAAGKGKEPAPLRLPTIPAPPPPESAPQPVSALAAGPPPVPAADASREKAAERLQAEARDSLARKAEARPAAAVMGGVASAAPAPMARKAKVGQAPEPAWTLEPRPEGGTLVLVTGPAGAHAVLLRRSASGIEVLALKPVDSGGGATRWAAEVRLGAEDALDLYLLNAPAPDPARLPETGPVDGFRTRIHPAAKKDRVR